MSTTLATEAIAIRRSLASALAAHFQIPLGCLGAPFVDPETDASRVAAAGEWWTAQPEGRRIPRELIAGLAAPAAVADIRILLERSTLTKTWALACGVEPNAPWLLLAPVTSDNDYHVQPCAARAAVTDLLMGHLAALSPAWESQMRFQLKTPAFALLLALVDLYSRAQYASLLMQQAVPEGFDMEDIRLAWENAIQRPDQRYLFPLAAHLFPDALNNLLPGDAATLVYQIAEVGLLAEREKNYFWTDSGRFLAESLHRRNVTLAIEVAGADAGGRLAAQASLFVRSDLPLWFFDIGAESCIAAGVSDEKARELLDGILKPVGVPPAVQREVEAPAPAPTLPPPPPVSAPPPPPPPAAAAPASVCPVCGAAVAPGARFCGNCGQPSAPPMLVCAHCQTQSPPGTQFCRNCGTRFP